MGFRSILSTSVSNPKLCEIIYVTKSSNLVKLFGGFEGSSPAELAFFDRQCAIIEEHLASVDMQSRIEAATSFTPRFEECICLTLWLYNSWMLRSRPHPPAIYSQRTVLLRGALADAPRGWDDQIPLLLWISCVGIHASLDEAHRQWFLSLIRILCVHLELHHPGPAREKYCNSFSGTSDVTR